MIALLLATGDACGGDDEAPPVAGVPGDRALADLSEDEFARVCSAISDAAVQDTIAVQGDCALRGAVGSLRDVPIEGPPEQAMAACASWQQRCLEHPPITTACDRVHPELPQCSASVDDLRRCHEDARALVARWANTTCQQARDYWVRRAPEMPSDACERAGSCRSLFDIDAGPQP
jgi:hypothetical protein